MSDLPNPDDLSRQNIPADSPLADVPANLEASFKSKPRNRLARVLDEQLHYEWTEYTDNLHLLNEIVQDLKEECERLFRQRHVVSWMRQLTDCPQHLLVERFEDFRTWYREHVFYEINDIILSLKAFTRGQGRGVLQSSIAAYRSSHSAIPNEWLPEHEALVCLFLKRENILAPNLPMPEVLESSTGKQGLSVVYHFTVNDVLWVAKFDPRDSIEWEKINRLRLENVPPDVILPHPNNGAGDGFMLSEAAASPGADRCKSLEKYLPEYIGTNLGDCKAASIKVQELLGNFYQSAEHGIQWRHEPRFGSKGTWRDYFIGLEDSLCFQNGIQSLTKIVESLLNEQALELVCPVINNQSVSQFSTSFVERVAEKYSSPLLSVAFSRTHGDLNLGNILICPGQNGHPISAQIIDLANSEKDSVIAADLAWFEVDSWQVLFEHSLKNNTINSNSVWSSFVRIRNFLDGRCSREQVSGTLNSECMSYLEFILHWRMLSAKRLRNPVNAGGYVLRDYFHCLLFSSIKILLLRKPVSDEASTESRLLIDKVLVASAILSLDAIDCMYRYGEGADCPRLRPWEGLE